MRYRYADSLTHVAQAQIDDYTAGQTARANEALARRQTAEELLMLLTDPSSLITPDYVLRRYIQTCGELVSREECPDLSRTGNVPWPPEVIQRAAGELSRLSLSRHRLSISTQNWEKYLGAEMPQGLHREMIFKLAVVTKMDRGTTMDLLSACSQSPYNLRNPLELICWFCQGDPERCTWQDILRLKKGSESLCTAPALDAAPSVPARGETQLLRRTVDALGRPGEESAELRLMEVIAKSCGALEGFSLTAREKYLRLMDYLSALYLPGQTPSLRKTVVAMLEAQGWDLEGLLQTPKGDRYVFRGEEANREGSPRREDCTFDIALGRIAMFCKRYYSRASAIRTGKAGVDRRDILLLGYLLMTGCEHSGGETEPLFRPLLAEGGELDLRMEQLCEELDGLADVHSAKEKQELCCRILNELLAEFGFRCFYYPEAFDRFVLLSLLTDSPARTARVFLGREEV